MQSMNKKYAIFDMDGTLVDSMKYWRALAAEYLESRGIEKLPEDIMKKIKPMTMAQSAEFFKKEFGFSESTKTIENDMNQLMRIHYKEDVDLKKGVKNHLEKLKGKNVHMCVASATDTYLVEECLKRLGVFGYFDFIISCSDVGYDKNNPEIYLEAVRRFGGTLSETIVYEDAPYAIRTAEDTGFYVIRVNDDTDFSKL